MEISGGKSMKGSWACVTGASSGIGKAIALALAGEGMNLKLVGRSTDKLQKVADECKQKGSKEAKPCSVDLSNTDKLTDFGKKLQGLPAMEVLVNAAGTWTPHEGNRAYGTTRRPDIEDIETQALRLQGPLDGNIADWEKELKVNVHAPMILTRMVAPNLAAKKSGLIVNIGSVCGVRPQKKACACALRAMQCLADGASKWALRGWSLSCYENLKSHGVKVQLINPGIVNTALIDEDMAQQVGGRDKMLQPEDIAAAVLLAVRSQPNACPVEITIRSPVDPDL